MSLATEMLALYIQAEKDVLKGKSISVNGRSMSSENLSDIVKSRKEWQRVVNGENAKKSGGSSNYSVADFR